MIAARKEVERLRALVEMLSQHAGMFDYASGGSTDSPTPSPLPSSSTSYTAHPPSPSSSTSSLALSPPGSFYTTALPEPSCPAASGTSSSNASFPAWHGAGYPLPFLQHSFSLPVPSKFSSFPLFPQQPAALVFQSTATSTSGRVESSTPFVYKAGAGQDEAEAGDNGIDQDLLRIFETQQQEVAWG